MTLSLSPNVARSDSRGLNAALAKNEPVADSSRTARHSQDSQSQILMLSSADFDARIRESGEYETAVTAPMCPSKTAVARPFAGFQIRMVRSAELEASIRPSAEGQR